VTHRVAAIDCGTNSLRLLIADLDPAAKVLTDIERRMEIVRLGQGVDATGRLAPEALARTMRVLAEYAEHIGREGATAVRMVATSATRDASNAAEFSQGVQDILGVVPEVISGGEEARLSFTGATAELSGAGAAGPEPPYLVVDIGGGSTEFVLGGDAAGPGDDVTAISVDIGSVRLTERHLHGDPPTAAEIQAASDDIYRALDRVAATVPVAGPYPGGGPPDPRRPRTLVGVAGSVTTLTAIALDLAAYDPGRTHHARLGYADVHRVTAELLGQSHDERARIPALHPGRVDVIGAGALILDLVMDRFGFTEMVTSEHDILDGIAWSIADSADGGWRPPHPPQDA
jgi:exopolyphosphatase / guanosine-5'-triphosphate,3'-diphosphate pyrophosphatase